MGDGPGYDHRDRVMREHAEQKLARQKKRLTVLHALMASHGFGENDSDTLVERRIAEKFREAYELLSLVIASKRGT